MPNEIDPNALAERLNSAAIHLLRRVRVADEQSGLTAPKLSALSVLVFGGPRTLGELAAAEQVRPPTITRIIQELEAAGFATRKTDKLDRRIVHVRATGKGVRLLREGRTRRARLLAGWLRPLSAAKLRKLDAAVHLLEKLGRIRE